jgi:2-polyprenyl-3-methyl-5-hydroxy-6-metoxy-1,4-benzoquinol methylase
MAYDPVHQGQLYAWRAGHLLSKKSPETTRLDGLDEEGRERFFLNGHQQVTTLAERIEAQTGFALDSCRALDFGCGVGRNALGLAERCEHVYGLDVSPAVLREADHQAKRLNLTNVDWMDAGRLEELSGRYDLAISFFVFQHIPSREGERIFATLVGGLRPGGAGAIHVTLRPGLRRPSRSYLYSLMNSYSLNRLGKLLADQGITEWHAKMHARPAPGSNERSYADVTLLFRKD